jgi:hypothetical protein
MVLAAAIFPLGTRVSWANEHAPDPRMLLDLDLFAPNSGGGPQNEDSSMLQQIRTLQAMGYLGGSYAPNPQPVYNGPPPPPPPLPPEDSEDDIRE